MDATSLIVTQEAEAGFYPTPPALAERLLAGIKWEKVETVLEPQAGKGNIVRAVMKEYVTRCPYGDQKLNVDCVEIDPYLRSILQYEFCGKRKSELFERLHQLDKKKRYNHQTHSQGELNADEEEEREALLNETDMLDRLSLHIVHDDFLTFDSRKHYNLIVMNPPFADGDAHLLKAIELQKRYGGQIRCLLNAETILNPYTNRRKVLGAQLDELSAEVEYIEGGFTDGERPTDVTVALIKIIIPHKRGDSSIFQRLSKAAHIEEENVSDVTDMAVTDFMEQIVSRFNVEVDAGLELIREYNNMQPYILQSFGDTVKGGYLATTLVLSTGTPEHPYDNSKAPTANNYLKMVRRKYWSALFGNKEFVGKLTSNLREKYRGMVDKMVDYDFTLFNIQQIAEQMNAEMGRGIQETIVALFDKLTDEHSWYPECSKNIHYFNGWKTNKVHKINSKVIIPTYGMFSTYAWSAKDTFQVREAENVISDIEKVFDYLDGDATACVDLHGILLRACEAGQTKNIPCKYFDVTLYKKGTMHIKFRNQALVDRFNIYCCRKKNWLPPSYGKTAYKDMTTEERTVLDGFHGDGNEGTGEIGYQKVMERATYYLAEPTRETPMLMPPEA